MAKKNAPPLIIEHFQNRSNMMFLALIEYKKTTYLTVIDNIRGNEISAFVLDTAEAEDLDISWFVTVATRWYYESSEKYPLSFEFARLGQADAFTSILKTFKIDYVSRLVGKIFHFDLDRKPKIKRKKVQLIPSGVEIKFKKVPHVE